MRWCWRFGDEHVFAASLPQQRREACRRPVAVALHMHDGTAREFGNHRAKAFFELVHVDFN